MSFFIDFMQSNLNFVQTFQGSPPQTTSFETNNCLPNIEKSSLIKQGGASNRSYAALEPNAGNIVQIIEQLSKKAMDDPNEISSLSQFLQEAKALTDEQKKLLLSNVIINFCIAKQQNLTQSTQNLDQAQAKKQALLVYANQVAALNFLPEAMQPGICKHLQQNGIVFTEALNKELFSLQTMVLQKTLPDALQQELDQLRPINFKLDRWTKGEKKTMRRMAKQAE